MTGNPRNRRRTDSEKSNRETRTQEMSEREKRGTDVAASKTQQSFAAKAHEVTDVVGLLFRVRGARTGREKLPTMTTVSFIRM